MRPKMTWNLSTLSREDRLLVLYARKANNDTYSGSAGASVRAARSFLGQSRDVVNEVYSASAGRVPHHLDAFECGECGCAFRGYEDAAACCTEEPEPMEDEE